MWATNVKKKKGTYQLEIACSSRLIIVYFLNFPISFHSQETQQVNISLLCTFFSSSQFPLNIQSHIKQKKKGNTPFHQRPLWNII